MGFSSLLASKDFIGDIDLECRYWIKNTYECLHSQRDTHPLQIGGRVEELSLAAERVDVVEERDPSCAQVRRLLKNVVTQTPVYQQNDSTIKTK